MPNCVTPIIIINWNYLYYRGAFQFSFRINKRKIIKLQGIFRKGTSEASAFDAVGFCPKLRVLSWAADFFSFAAVQQVKLTSVFPFLKFLT